MQKHHMETICQCKIWIYHYARKWESNCYKPILLFPTYETI